MYAINTDNVGWYPWCGKMFVKGCGRWKRIFSSILFIFLESFIFLRLRGSSQKQEYVTFPLPHVPTWGVLWQACRSHFINVLSEPYYNCTRFVFLKLLTCIVKKKSVNCFYLFCIYVQNFIHVLYKYLFKCQENT